MNKKNKYAPQADQEVLASLEHPSTRLVLVHLSAQDGREDRPIRRSLDHLCARVDPEDPRNHPYPGKMKISRYTGDRVYPIFIRLFNSSSKNSKNEFEIKTYANTWRPWKTFLPFHTRATGNTLIPDWPRLSFETIRTHFPLSRREMINI